MIEINLIPDVKFELLKARRVRTQVVTASILAAIIAGGVVLLLTLYVFGAQTVTGALIDSSIEKDFKKLKNVDGLSETLTLQNQLSKLSDLQSSKLISSRLIDLTATIVPTGTNQVAISELKLDTENNTVIMQAEAKNGYEALEVFRKTIAETKLSYRIGSDAIQEDAVASKITDGERSYGENSNSERVLRFTLSFEYNENLFNSEATGVRIIAPTKQNATDSVVGIPSGLFTDAQKENR